MNELSTSFCSAVIFYTVFPLPITWTNSWQRIARWASLIGLIIAGLLSLWDLGLQYCGLSSLSRGAIIAILWLGITGGLHLDGAMDTADGLAVSDRKKSLEVMRDSATGAFGAMVAVAIVLLKTIALSENTHDNWLLLLLAAGWSRWGQLIAIALYPYARETGKGAFHKEHLRIVPDIFLSSLVVLLATVGGLLIANLFWIKIILIVVGCVIIPFAVGYYFYAQLAGHTGDTYGAVVEWSEVFILLFLMFI